MRSLIKYLIPILVLPVLLSACGSSSNSSSSGTATSQPAAATSSSAAAVVKSASNSQLHGTILVNAHGMTLYALSAETGGKFICTSKTCLQNWHPVTVSGSGSPSGAVGSLGTVKRSDGTVQVTYKGMPLTRLPPTTRPARRTVRGSRM